MISRPKFNSSIIDSVIVDSEEIPNATSVKFDPRDESNFDKPEEGTFIKPEMITDFHGKYFITDRRIQVYVDVRYRHHKWRYEGKSIQNGKEKFDIWDINGYSPDSGTIVGFSDSSKYNAAHWDVPKYWKEYTDYHKTDWEEIEFLKQKKRQQRYCSE